MFSSFLRPIVTLAALSGLAAYATIMLRGPEGLNALAEKHREIRALQESNDKLGHALELKRVRIERLKSDPNTLEVELERMGLMHPHDTRFQSTDPSVKSPVGGNSTATSPSAKR